jgi:phage terminase large subunit-like protein
MGMARQVVTTTPRPVRVIRSLLADPTCVVTRGRMLDNAANLSPTALSYLLSRYEGTRLGRQELDAEVLEDVPGALWTRGMMLYHAAPTILRDGQVVPDLARIVVAVDPKVSSDEGADEAGITVHGVDHAGRGYLLDDRSAAVGPIAWARRAVQAAEDYEADSIVAESNQGGEMVRLTIEQVMAQHRRFGGRVFPVRLVNASRGKRTRA